MRNLTTEAGFAALKEIEDGKKCVVILFPSGKWAPCALDMGKVPEHIHLRFSDMLTVDTLLIDTLILVAPDDDDWDQKGLAFFKERLPKDGNLIKIVRTVSL